MDGVYLYLYLGHPLGAASSPHLHGIDFTTTASAVGQAGLAEWYFMRLTIGHHGR